MRKHSYLLVLLFLAFASWTSAQQSSLVGTWVGKVQGYGVEMKLILNADGSADYEGVMGRWRVQGAKLLLTQEGETVGYNFALSGSQLTLSGGDLMAPMVMTRAEGRGRRGRTTAAPVVTAPAEAPQEEDPPAVQSPPPRGQATPPTSRPASSRRGLSEAEVTKLLEGSVPSNRIIQLVEERGIAFALNAAAASRLKAKGATNALIGALQDAEDRGGREVAAAQPPQEAAPRASNGARSSSVASSATPARGSRYRHDNWGISFVNPPGWKVGERQGLLLMGSDTEAGLIIIRLARRTSLQQLMQDYHEGMQEDGMLLIPTVEAREFPAGQNQAMAGELAGTAQDGAQIRARAVAVASPFGDAAVVLGMTTQEKYAGLKPRVESIASSFQFSQPKAPPVLDAIAGQYFYFSSSGSGSTERYIDMCSDGRFSSRSGTYSTGSAGTAYGEGGASATWTAEGDGAQGVIVVTNRDGSVERYPYQRSGSDLHVNNRTFARYGDGSCTKSSPF